MASTIQVIDMLDAIGVNAGRIPKGTKRVSIYLTGSGGIAWTNADVALLVKDDPQLQTITRIDQSNTTALSGLSVYLIKDIESGASTVSTAVVEATTRMKKGLRTGFYFSRADWDVVVKAISAVQGLAAFIDFWVADWNLDRAGAIGFMESDPRIKAVQYSNGQFYDFSVTRSDWPAPMPAKPKSGGVKGTVKKVINKIKGSTHPKVTVGGITGVLTAALLAFLNSHGTHVTSLDPAEASAVTLAATVIAGLLTPNKK